MKKIFLILFTFFICNVYTQNSINLDISVVNEYSKDAISFANIKIVNLNTNQIERKKTDFNGQLKLKLIPNMSYKLIGSSVSDSSIVIFKEKTIDFNTQGIEQGTTIQSTFKLRPIFQKQGLNFLEDINFTIFTYTIDKMAKNKLDNVIEIMNRYPEIKIDVAGYASCNLSVDDANNVSVARATEVFTYITDAGIDYTRITATAWGKDKSITKCKCELTTKKDKPCTKRHHLINSRVSMDFSGIDD